MYVNRCMQVGMDSSATLNLRTEKPFWIVDDQAAIPKIPLVMGGVGDCVLARNPREQAKSQLR